MHSRRLDIDFAILLAGLGAVTVILFARGLVVPGALGAALVAGLGGWRAWAGRRRRPSGPAASPFGAVRPATAPPDGHLRFTLVVDGLEPDRIAEVWADLCRPDRPATDEFRLLFRTFPVVEGRRFRFRRRFRRPASACRPRAGWSRPRAGPRRRRP